MWRVFSKSLLWRGGYAVGERFPSLYYWHHVVVLQSMTALFKACLFMYHCLLLQKLMKENSFVPLLSTLHWQNLAKYLAKSWETTQKLPVAIWKQIKRITNAWSPIQRNGGFIWMDPWESASFFGHGYHLPHFPELGLPCRHPGLTLPHLQ